MRLFATNAIPQQLKDFATNVMILRNPNFVVREFQSRGLPHKLTGLVIDAITEQCPDPESRITLSQKTDALGVPLARVDWRIDNDARRSLVRLGHLLAGGVSARRVACATVGGMDYRRPPPRRHYYRYGAYGRYDTHVGQSKTRRR